MAHSFEYKTVIRTTRVTSGHEAEELDELLNFHGTQGWHLHSIVQVSPGHQIVIFEREMG